MKPIFEQWELDYIRDNYEIKSYKEITNYLNLHNTIKKDEKQVRTKASRLGYRKQNTSINKDFFEVVNTEEKAYWLGFIYADGYVSMTESKGQQEVGIELNVVDIVHLKKLDQAINGNLPINIRTRKPTIIKGVQTGEREVCSIRIYSRKMVSDLIKQGVTPRKTYSTVHPIIDDGKMFFHFLRGFFDGDGCIYLDDNNNVKELKFTNPNLKFLQYIEQRLKEYNIDCKMYCEDELKYNLRISSYSKYIFLELLYNESTVFLDRKHEKYKCAVLTRNSWDN